MSESRGSLVARIESPETVTPRHKPAAFSLRRTWFNMIWRCHTCPPESREFQNYRGRGIVVCDEWRASFEAFAAHIGKRPTPKHSLDRIDNDGNYEPGNIRWATPAQQVSNRRRRKGPNKYHRRIGYTEITVETCAAQGVFRMFLMESGDSLAGFGRRAGVSAPAVRKWIQGPYRPEPHYRLWLQRICGIPFDDWFTDEEYECAYGHARGEAVK